MKFTCYIFLLSLSFLGCKQNSDSKEFKKNLIGFQYIQQVSWEETKDSLRIISNENVMNLAKKQLPLKTVMVIPTSAIAYLDELGLTNQISGISQPNFIYNPKVQGLIHSEKIQEIGTYNELYIEKILLQKPDILISTTSPTLAKYHELLKNNGVPILLLDEYLEPEPLARAEYVKLFGRLFGKEKQADSLFHEIELNYQKIQKLVHSKNRKQPSVLLNQMYGDVWYMPGGKSFQAKLIEDAGGNYLWSEDKHDGSLHLSFETVFEKANFAEFWVNAGDYPDLQSLVNSYQNYTWFSAIKEKKVYNWNQRITEKGANDYFERGTARPDLVLQDLAAIFHPDLFPNHRLTFYKNLK